MTGVDLQGAVAAQDLGPGDGPATVAQFQDVVADRAQQAALFVCLLAIQVDPFRVQVQQQVEELPPLSIPKSVQRQQVFTDNGVRERIGGNSENVDFFGQPLAVFAKLLKCQKIGCRAFTWICQ